VEPHFGVLVLPDAPFPTLFERWTHVEELGFDSSSRLITPDTPAIRRSLGSMV
jgi:hypothetical protein